VIDATDEVAEDIDAEAGALDAALVGAVVGSGVAVGVGAQALSANKIVIANNAAKIFRIFVSPFELNE
jgi:hypothetical protein